MFTFFTKSKYLTYSYYFQFDLTVIFYIFMCLTKLKHGNSLEHSISVSAWCHLWNLLTSSKRNSLKHSVVGLFATELFAYYRKKFLFLFHWWLSHLCLFNVEKNLIAFNYLSLSTDRNSTYLAVACYEYIKVGCCLYFS